MSAPMTAKSPLSSSQMSGQPLHPAVFAPPACGSGPILRINIVEFIADTITNVLVKSNNFFRAKYHRRHGAETEISARPVRGVAVPPADRAQFDSAGTLG